MMGVASATCVPDEELHLRGKRRRAVTTTRASPSTSPHSMDSGDNTRVMRRRGNATRWRWLGPTVACMAAASRLPMAALVDAASATTTDGVTYCWNVSGSVYSSVLSDAAELQSGQQDECPLTLSLQVPKDSFYVNEAIQATWTATLRADANGVMAANKFGMQQLYLAQDRISQKQVQVVYSKIESCSTTATNCDPVTGHTDLSPNVVNKAANFTSGVATFSTDKLVFISAGSVKLVAHVILPGQNPDEQRMDFALYRTVTINNRPSLASVDESTQNHEQTAASVTESKGLSTEVIGILFVCGMVAVALVAVGFAVMRKTKIRQPAGSLPDKGPDGRTRHDATSTDLDDEFAMLSNDEKLMQSRVRPRTNTASTFLSATAQKPPSMLEESRAKAKTKGEAPLAGHSSGNGSARSGKNNAIGADDLASDDHIVDDSNPSSVRHNGHYMEMQPPVSVPMQSRAVASMPAFNDIKEHEVLKDSGRRREQPRGAPSSMAASTMSTASSASSALDPFVMGRSPRADALASRVADTSAWRVSTELTFDDLRESNQGPALTIDDLLESKQIRKKRVNGTISESSEM